MTPTQPFPRSEARARSRAAFGFSLVEVMVAITVLALILGIIVQISSGTLMATKGVLQKIESGEGARSVMDALGSDLSNLAMSQGLSVFFGKPASPTTDNTILSFVTQSRGPQPPTGVSYRFISVSYQLSSTGELTRYSLPLTWSDQTLVTDAVAASTSSTFSVLAQGILRFVAVAILDDGTLVPLTASNTKWNNTSISGTAIPSATINGVSTAFYGLNLTDRGVSVTGTSLSYTRNRVRALTVAVVSLDSKNYSLLKSTGKLTSTISLFPFPSTPAVANQTPTDAWEPIFSSGSLNSLPKPAVSALQVFQNTFSLN